MMENEKRKKQKCLRGLPVRNRPVETLRTGESGRRIRPNCGLPRRERECLPSLGARHFEFAHAVPRSGRDAGGIRLATLPGNGQRQFVPQESALPLCAARQKRLHHWFETRELAPAWTRWCGQRYSRGTKEIRRLFDDRSRFALAGIGAGMFRCRRIPASISQLFRDVDAFVARTTQRPIRICSIANL